jgi:prophage DNA circulation protein
MSDALGFLTQTAGTSLQVDNSGQSWMDGAWFQQLQPGSWRGCGFVLDAGDTRAGRRVAIHEYPYRDDAWVEDLGKLPRRFSIQAFVVGDDVYQQRDAMLAACEQPGPGTLVHPTLGSIQCVLLEPLQCTDRRERGRVVELAFAFIIAGDVLYPSTSVATGQNVQAQAGALNAASAGDLARSLGSLQSLIPAQVTGSVAGFAAMATDAVNDPTRALNAVAGLQGFYGRFATGSRQTMQPAGATVSTVLADGVVQRSAVLAAAASLTASAGAL